MNAKGLALVSAAAFLLMSEVASAAGPPDWLRDVPGKVPGKLSGIVRAEKAASKLGPTLHRGLDKLITMKNEMWAREIEKVTARKVSALYDEATPQILRDLDAAGTLTKEKVERIIATDLATAAQRAAKETKSGITFEVLSGKLTVESSYALGRISLGKREIYIYKWVRRGAEGVFACWLSKREPGVSFEECAKTALAKIEGEIKVYIEASAEKLPDIPD